ncbi:MAG: hypothetical protein B7Z75_06505 [Acidocella sp. 20-57-95]|nr:MAG: hypothetical protein B7Z75_06505 [Acidocella sp. 20-57-95]HQT64793.1 nucleotidyltransferase family protein [Acidocella sp.]
MEWLPPRIADRNLLKLLGTILKINTSFEDAVALRSVCLKSGFAWQELVEFASRQDLLPPLIWSLKKHSLLIPPPKTLSAERRSSFITTRLTEEFNTHLARQHDLREQLLNCISALNQVGITPLLLKGARYLLAPETSWEAARPMRDMDLLIPPTHAAAAVTALVNIGYIANEPTNLRSHHLPELHKPGRHGMIELHTEPLALLSLNLMPTEFVWQVAEPAAMPSAREAALVLPPIWQALHAMLHHQVSDNGFNLHTLALKSLWEFSSLAATFNVAEWTKLIEQTRAVGSDIVFASWCLQARDIYGLALPPSLPLPETAHHQVHGCFAEAGQPEIIRRVRFILRQLRRGFSAEVMAVRYAVPPHKVGISLRLQHLWFLLKRYRSTLNIRLSGRAQGLGGGK